MAREALSTGVGVATDLLDGGSGIESLERRLPAAGRRLANKGVRKLSRMIDQPQKKKRRKTIKGRDIFA